VANGDSLGHGASFEARGAGAGSSGEFLGLRLTMHLTPRRSLR
jgi:hypothetical protein